MTQDDSALFGGRMSLGAKNVIASSCDLFEPVYLSQTQHSAMAFASTLENLLDDAPQATPQMEETLEHARESVRQFIKTASQLYGSIGTTLERF